MFNFIRFPRLRRFTRPLHARHFLWIVPSTALLIAIGIGSAAQSAESDDVPAILPSQPESTQEGQQMPDEGVWDFASDWLGQAYAWIDSYKNPFSSLRMALWDIIWPEMDGAFASMRKDREEVLAECQKDGLSPGSEEFRQRIRESDRESFMLHVMTAIRKGDPKIQAFHVKRDAEDRKYLQELMGMSDMEFEVVAPHLERVRVLRAQRQMINLRQLDHVSQFDVIRYWDDSEDDLFLQSMSMDMYSRFFLGEHTVEPSVRAYMAARTALRSIIRDRQANAGEAAAAVARLREARKRFEAVLGKAEAELCATLTPRQQGLLVQEGLLD